MAAKVRLKDLQLGQLDNECLLQVNYFLRALKAHNGVVLRIQDKDILMQISEHAKKSKSRELKRIYAELKAKILNSVQETLRSKRS